MRLPEPFLERMKRQLGEEYEAWLLAMGQEPLCGLRVNCSKLSVEAWEQLSPFELERIPWTLNGYYYNGGERPATDPYYFAGLYYLQEPSAMFPAAVLNIRPGDRVLDLCAAPGGKSTELGACLKDTGGLLVSNDPSCSRAGALLKNLELFGLSDILVTVETPEKLADNFGHFFDKIIVDAPCSGEGMFRKDAKLTGNWLERGPDYYAPIQREILKQAVRMLKPGGQLLYSTCTFSELENEDTVNWLLKEEPSIKPVPILRPGISPKDSSDSSPCIAEGIFPSTADGSMIRLYPHRVRGEGHFAALLQSNEGEADRASPPRGPHVSSRQQSPLKESRFSPDDAFSLRRLEKETDFLLWERLFARPFDRSRMMIKGTSVYLLPADFDPSWKLRFLRTGLLLGKCKNKHFEPSQAAAMAICREDFAQTLSLAHEDERVLRYLKGETLLPGQEEKFPNGWILVCVDGYPLGWAKNLAGKLKNKYYAGWRRQ